MKTLAIAATSVRRLLRERSNIFFVFILPMLLILVLGAAFGGETDPRVGVVSVGSGPLGEELAQDLRSTEGVDVRDYGAKDELVLAVERGRVDAGVIVPAGYDQALRSGDEVVVQFVIRPDPAAQVLRSALDSATSRQGGLLRAAAFAREQRELDFEQALMTARQVAEEAPRLQVRREAEGDPFALDRLGQFDLGAYTQLLLFVFLTSLTGSSALIQARQLGVSRRMLSTPTPVGTILAGEALGRLAVALVQGLFIMLGSALVFGVDWGDPLGAAAILVVFSAGAAAAGMLMGSVFKNDQQAGGIGVVAGLGLAALGGCMLPLAVMKVFAPTLWRVAHLTPHAWGVEAFEELILRQGNLLDILPELGILAAFALAVFSLATWRLRIALTRA